MTPALRQSGMEDIFTFPFSDPKSPKKLLIAVLLMLAGFVIPFLPVFVLYGYMLEMRRRLILDKNPRLPEWDRWGKYFKDGAKACAIVFLYMLPVLLLALIGFAVVFIPGFVLADHGYEMNESDPTVVFGTGLISLAGVVGLGITMLMGAIIVFLLPAAVTHFAVKGRIRHAFRFGEWWSILRGSVADFLIAFILLVMIGIFSVLLAQILSLTVVLCALVPFIQSIITVYGMFVLSGQIAKAYKGGL